MKLLIKFIDELVELTKRYGEEFNKSEGSLADAEKYETRMNVLKDIRVILYRLTRKEKK